MMKSMTFLAVAFAACFTLSAQQPAAAPKPVAPAEKPVAPAAKFQTIFATNLNPAKYENQAEAAQLIKQREQLILLMLQKRQEIIRKDRKAKELHQKILELQKELGVLIENKRDMIELNARLFELDRKIDHLEPKKQVPAAKPAVAPVAAPAAKPAVAPVTPTPAK